MKSVNVMLRMFLLSLLFWGQSLPAVSGDQGLCPTNWVMFGPLVHNADLSYGGTPSPSMFISGEQLKTVPEQLEINGQVYQARQLDYQPGQTIDFDEFADNPPRGAVAYLFALLDVPAATNLRMGAGADWWMQWWLNGQPVFDTLDSSNLKSPIRADNHIFDLTLKSGKNVLAAAVVRGSSSFAFAAGDPNSRRLSSNSYDEAMRWARELLSTGGLFVKGAVNFKALRSGYETAVQASKNVEQKKEALSKLAEARLYDPKDEDYEGIRNLFRELEALAEIDLPRGGTPVRRRTIDRARAVLGIGMAYLAEGRSAEARREFDRVEIARFGKIGDSIPQDIVCGLTTLLLQETSFQRAWSYIHDRRYADAWRELAKILNIEGVTEYSKAGIRARQMREVLRQLTRLRHDHPRMFFNEDAWPDVMERALGPERAHFEAMQKRVSAYLPDSPNIFASFEGETAAQTFWLNQPEDWGMRTMEAAFVYRVTRDPATLTIVRRMLREAIDYFLSREVTRCRSYPRIAWMAALDWVWNDLPPDERNSLRAGLLEYVYALQSEDKLQGHALNSTHYYERNVYRYAGMFSIDNDLDDVAHTRALEILSRDAWLHIYGGDIKLRLKEGLTGQLTKSLLDYCIAEAQNELWPVLHAWESALKKRIPPELVYIFSSDYILRNTLGFNPGLLHFGYSRAWRKADGCETPLLYDHLARYIYFFGATSPEYAGIARHLRDRISKEGVAGGGGQFPVLPFLVDIPETPAAAIPPGMPIARHFELAGNILMSSGFGPEDTYALYSCGSSRTEAHFDTTHFTIYKKGWLALDSGTRALLHGGVGKHYDEQTIAHNAVLIYMEGEEMPKEAVNSGGQRRYPGDANLLAYESDRLFAYMATDATPVYHTNKCAAMTRQFVFLPPNHFVVFDRVISRRADYPKTWLLHTANEPAIQGREFSAAQGQGKIFCRTLLPADATLHAVGGPGKEFWAGGQNWEIPTNRLSRSWVQGVVDESGNICEQVGRWRVEVCPGSMREEDHFLHLIEVGDASTAAMTDSKLLETDTSVGIRFKVGTQEYTVQLHKNGDLGGEIRIAEGDRILVDRAFTSDVMSQHGLALMDAKPTILGAVETNVGKDISGDVAALIQQLSGEQPGRLEDDPPAEAALALLAQGEQAVEPLITVLHHNRADTRRLAAWVLGEMRVDSAAAPLAKLLDDDDGFVRTSAETALGRLDKSAAVEVQRFLRADRLDTRLHAIRALGRIGGNTASQALVELLDDEVPQIRFTAAEALGHARTPEICASMIPLLGDDDLLVRERTIWSLRQLLSLKQLSDILDAHGGFLADGLSDPDPVKRAEVTKTLIQLGEASSGLALRALRSAKTAGHRHAAETLARIKTHDIRVLEPLLATLHDSTDNDLRAFAATALGNLGNKQAVTPLTALLTDDSADLRSAAATALGLLKDESVVTVLSELLNDADNNVRRAATQALGQLGPKALDSLLQALRDAEYTVRDAAADGIANIGDHSAIPALAAALATPEFIEAVPYIERQRVANSRCKLIHALSKMQGSRAAIEALLDQIEQAPRERKPHRDADTLNVLNRAMENVTGAFVYRGTIYPDRGYGSLFEDWKTWWQEHKSSF